MTKRPVLLSLTVTLSLALAACSSTPTPGASAGTKPQFIEPCDPYVIQSGGTGLSAQACGDPDPEPTDPEYISMPGTPQLVPWSNAAIAPAGGTAGLRSQWVPTTATDREDYVRQLFTRVNQNVTAPNTTTQTPIVDGRCTLQEVTATTTPDQLLAEQNSASSLFPSAILQGRFLAVQGLAPTPIHVPAGQRAQVRLVDSYLNTATMSTSTYTDYAQALRQMLVQANSNRDFAQSNIMFDVKTASTVEEASTKFNLDFKAYGADVKTKLDTNSSSSQNSVYAVFYQNLYNVQVDLSGNYPVNGLFNSSFGLNEIRTLGNTGEIDSANPPTYVTGATLGRMLIVRVSANASSSDLEAAVKVSFKQGSAALTATQKEIISSSAMTVYAVGGPAEPQIAVIKSGNYQSYFDTTNIAISSLKPMAYSVNYWDDNRMRVNRTYTYTKRDCTAIPSKKVELRFREVYDNAVIEVKRTGTSTFQRLGYSGNPGTVTLSPELLDSDAQIRVGVIGRAPSWYENFRWKMHVDLLIDGQVVDSFDRNCYACHSEGNLATWTVDKFTGNVYTLNKWTP
ncbi:thiol-activated cytolysin family protein [Deinococcus sedimenti]|uniref:Thiol-activated cytolysin n=1 Tax=Deinococcus sedimenti TaxID=1867090 RepID=A0ABQ2S234_9DEIO|nr:thiol-activated cytolysin family protein [Deinococcus sedimenti]GGR81446.1 hypothetical protein GCM10008960_05490 [Deinococcus sedimenti]